MIKKLLLTLTLMTGLSSFNAQATEKYAIDIEGMHAFVTFKIKHLGYSWLEGHFNKFSGSFDYDESNPSNNHVSMDIDITSLDSNHAERDKHLRSDRFFDSKKYPKATFVSTGWKAKGKDKATLTGKFTLRGVTKNISIDVSQIGAGNDPWGGYRRGFEGTATLKLSDYNMKESGKLGPLAENVELWIAIEGIRQ